MKHHRVYFLHSLERKQQREPKELKKLSLRIMPKTIMSGMQAFLLLVVTLAHQSFANIFASTATSGVLQSGKDEVMIKVAYQGEPGAYSEKSTRELLGKMVHTVGRPCFEDCYKAVMNQECDYACVPIENSLGGSIHDNYDLMLRYDLTIVGEHDFRVNHFLSAMPGVKKEDIKYAISHPQALAQCDNYLRANGITPIPTYDTAGSAKMISEDKLPKGLSRENTAAIASDLAAETYGLDVLAARIEDDKNNYTRFLLLARKGVGRYLTKDIPAKTSIVFTLPDSPGALYKALACFSLRDIDFSKIESRPTSANLLQYLRFRSELEGRKARETAKMPRFRYCFHLDFLTSQLDEDAQNALHHLREQASFIRVLGSYPQKSRLIGPVKKAAERVQRLGTGSSAVTLPSDNTNSKRLKIGIIGYGRFGRFIGKKISKDHDVCCLDLIDKSKEALEDGIEFYPKYDASEFVKNLDVVVLAVPIVDFEDVVLSLPLDRLKGKLIVETCPLGSHPKEVLLRCVPTGADIISTTPMFGPGSSSESWDGLPLLYEKVRIQDMKRADSYLSIFEKERCRLVEMSAEDVDTSIADAEFLTHLTGRLLNRDTLPPTIVSSKEYAALRDVAEMTAADTFDMFYGLFKFNPNASTHLNKMRDNLAKIERQIASKEAYLAAKAELQNDERQRILAECKDLLREVALSDRNEENNSIKSEISVVSIPADATNSTIK